MDVATVTSSMGLWTPTLKPWVLHFGCRHLGFSEPEVTMFGREGGALNWIASVWWRKSQWLKPVISSVFVPYVCLVVCVSVSQTGGPFLACDLSCSSDVSAKHQDFFLLLAIPVGSVSLATESSDLYFTSAQLLNTQGRESAHSVKPKYPRQTVHYERRGCSSKQAFEKLSV